MYTIKMKLHWFGLLVVLFNTCAKCLAMSSGELEDFTNYLHETSKLDHIHSKMNPFTPYNSDEKSNDEDDLALDNAWEESGKFEGDLILNDKQRKTIVDEVSLFARNGLRDSTKKWPNNEVTYYIQKEHFNEAQIQAIEDGIEDLGRASCVKFRPYKKGDRDAVVIQGSRRGCFSQVGYQGGYQVLNLSGRHPPGRGCFRHGTVVHELLHTLGFYHMQSSPDRDDYIDVAWENIIERAKHNFRKYNTFSVSDFGVGYDYESVLHYSRRAFSSNGQDTLIPKKNGAEIGQRIGLSDKDTQKLQKMYCDSDSNNYEADESTNLKLPAKKKVPKNIPFKGNGIGYHQGKTVIIKLPESKPLPQAKLPSYSASDYFSKLPLSTSPKGFGIVEEVDYNYDPWYKEILNIQKDETAVEIVKQQTSKDTTNQTNSEQNVTKGNERNKFNEHDDKNNKKLDVDLIKRENLIEAFERLGKIIKSLPPSVIGVENVPSNENVNLTMLKKKSDKNTEFQKIKDIITPNLSTAEHSISDEERDARKFIKKLHDSVYKSNSFYDKNNDNNKMTDKMLSKTIIQDQEKARVPDSKQINESYGTTYPFKNKYKNLYEDYKYQPDLKNLRNPYDYRHLINQQDNSNISDETGLLDTHQRFRSTDVPTRNSYGEKYTFNSHMNDKDTSYGWPARSPTFNESYDEISHEIGDVNANQDIVKSNLKFSTMLPAENDWNDKDSILPYKYPFNYNSRESFENSKEQDIYLNKKFEQYKGPPGKDSNKFYDIKEGELVPNKTIAKITKYTYSSEISDEDENESSSFKPLNYEVTEKIDEVTEKSHTKPFILIKKPHMTNTMVRSKPKDVKKTKDYENSSIQDQNMEAKLKTILIGYGHYEDYDTKAPYGKKIDHYEYH